MALNWFEKQVAARENDNANIARENRRGDLMAAEQAALDRQGDAFAAARNRRLNSVMDIALRDPGRYAPSVHRAAVEWDRQAEAAGLRRHELEVLKQQGENEFRVAKQKRFGMKEQGADAAGHNAEATKHGWDRQLEMEEWRQSGLTEREEMIGDRTERIAGMEHGTIGADGTVTPGSRERVAGINAYAVAQQAELKRQHELELEREKTLRNADTNQTRVVVGAGHDQARRDAAGAQQQRADKNAASRVDQDVMQGKYIASGMTPEKWKAMSEEERKAFRESVGVSQSAGGNQPPARRSWRDRTGTANQ